jgi:hypothetical protein
MSNEIVNGLVRLGYLPEGKQRKPTSLINRGIKNAGANLLINNVPEFSTPKESKQSEKITSEHIYDTIVSLGGSPVFVLQVSRYAYIAYVKDAEDMAQIIHGNMLDDNVLEVRFFKNARHTEWVKPVQKTITQEEEKKQDFLVSSPALTKPELILCKVVVGFIFVFIGVTYYYSN